MVFLFFWLNHLHVIRTEDGNDSQDPDENRVQYTGAKQRSISSNGRNLGQTLVFVDGYNIIHKWSTLKRQMEQENLGVARSTLIEHLADLRYVEGWTIEVCVLLDALQFQLYDRRHHIVLSIHSYFGLT